MEAIINTLMLAASQTLDKQAITSNNLANVSTSGFKQQLTTQLLFPIDNTIDVSDDKTFIPPNNNLWSDFSQGPILYTKRPLDVSIQGSGWFVVQDNTSKNKESYTRNGHLQINQDRKLVINNHLVLGIKGPITIPQTGNINISSHGIVNCTYLLHHKEHTIPIEKLKLINLDNKYIQRGNNGLFCLNEHGLKRLKKASFHDIKISPETLEESNVNLSETLINMISHERIFAIEMQLLSNYDENTKMANQLLNNNT